MSGALQLMVFRFREQRYALPLAAVERIVRAVEVTPLPEAPAVVLGVIDVQGRVLPVLDLGQRFALAPREIRPDDQFVLARAADRDVVLAVDQAEGVLEHPAAEIVSAAQVVPGIERVKGVVRLEDGLVLIHDLDRVLSLDEASALDEALRREAADGS